MADGTERIERIGEALRVEGLDALVCVLPTDVLMLSGYWPVVGTSVGVATRDGRVGVLAPEDERDLAEGGWATEVRTYAAGALTSLEGPVERMPGPLGALLVELGVAAGRIGYEDAVIFEQASYSATYRVLPNVASILGTAAPTTSVVSGAGAIRRLRSRLTPYEVDHVAHACQAAGAAFTAASAGMRAGLREPDVAGGVTARLEARGLAEPGAVRAGGFAWCMSGPNAALAGAAYARTRNRELRAGDVVLVHCNAQMNGYWTDITRTYSLGEPDKQRREMFEAMLAARAAALAAIRLGAAAADVDAAARAVLTARGYGATFTHGVGHNVGFSAISAEFPPRLRPDSPDRLEVGMTFNIEPAIYLEGNCGMRHCDVVTLRETGPEVLTPFQARLDELIIGG